MQKLDGIFIFLSFFLSQLQMLLPLHSFLFPMLFLFLLTVGQPTTVFLLVLLFWGSFPLQWSMAPVVVVISGLQWMGIDFTP